MPPDTPWGGRRHGIRSSSGAVTELGLGSDESRELLATQRQRAEARERCRSRPAAIDAGSGRRLSGLDRLEDELTEVLQERVHELEEPGLRDSPGRSDLDTEVETGAVAVGADLGGVAVLGDHRVAGFAAQPVGQGLRHVGDFLGLVAQALTERCQLLSELGAEHRVQRLGDAGHPALGVDGEQDGDVRTLDLVTAVIRQLLAHYVAFSRLDCGLLLG